MANQKITYDLNINTNNSANSIDQLTTDLDQMKIELRGLDVGSAAFKKLQNEVVAADSKMKNLTKSVEGMDMDQIAGEAGKFAGGVGAITSAFVLLGDSEDATMRELQENLNKGLGIMMAFKGGIELVTSAQKLWVPVQKALNAAMAANPIGLLVAGVVALTAVIIIYMEATKDANVELETFNEIQETAIKNAGKEKGELELLLRVARDETRTREDRNKVIKELQDRYPDYLGNLSTENIAHEDMAVNIALVNEQLIKKYQTQAAEEKLVELYSKQLELQTGLAEEIDPTKIQLFWNYMKSGGNAASFTMQNVVTGAENWTEALKINKLEIEAVNASMKKMGLLSDGFAGTEEIETFTDATKQELVYIDEYKNQLKSMGQAWIDFDKSEAIKNFNIDTGRQIKMMKDLGKTEEEVTKFTEDRAKSFVKILENEKFANVEVLKTQLESNEAHNNLLDTFYALNPEMAKLIKHYENINQDDLTISITKYTEAYQNQTLAIREQSEELRKLSIAEAEEQKRKDALVAQYEATKDFYMDLGGVMGEFWAKQELGSKDFLKQMLLSTYDYMAIYARLMMAQAGIGSMATTQSIATGGIGGVIQGAAIAIAIETALAAGKAALSSVELGQGGLLLGPSHSQGGIYTPYGEVEGGEAVINKRSTQRFAPVLSAINQSEGGRAIGGGSTGDLIDYDRLATAMKSQKVYVVSSDITDQQTTDTKVIKNIK